MRIRPATVDDAPIILDLIAAHETPLIGGPNATLEDVTDELTEPGWTPSTDGWLIFADSSSSEQAVGWGWCWRKGDSDLFDIAVYRRPGHDDVARWLWDTAQARAIELGAARIDNGIYPNDELLREIAAAHDFVPAATFVRMRIDHPAHAPYPSPLDGVELRHGTSSEDVRRDALNVRNESFADHFGYVAKTYEGWVTERESSSAHDWSMIHVAYVDDEPAACMVRTNNFVPDENCGYVLTLGTSPKYQGRGLGSYLLRYAFAADAEQGRVGTILHVDTNPDRPALELYRRNGMREVLQIDVWRKTIDR